MPVTHIKTNEQLKTLMRKGSKPIIAKFGATWCGPCRAIAPEFEKYATDSRFSSVAFVSIDIDEAADVAELYSVSSVPTFIAISGGREVDRFSGASKGQLQELISVVID